MKLTDKEKKCTKCNTIQDIENEICSQCSSTDFVLLVKANTPPTNKVALRNILAISLCGIPANILGVLSIVFARNLSGIILTICTVVIAIIGIILGSRIFDRSNQEKRLKRKWSLQNTNVVICSIAIILALAGFLMFYRFHYSTQFW